MTQKQIEKCRYQILAIRKTLAEEKRKYGGYDDSRGLRYGPPRYYLKLQDFKGAMVYYRWFDKNFSDDSGAPVFLFEWCITLFKNKKLPEATQKAFETFWANTYLLDKFLGNPMHPHDNFNTYAAWHKEKVLTDFGYSAEQVEWTDFSIWLRELVASDAFQAKVKEYFDLEFELNTASVGERRSALVRSLWELREG
jgi:hypothetical protein